MLMLILFKSMIVFIKQFKICNIYTLFFKNWQIMNIFNKIKLQIFLVIF